MLTEQYIQKLKAQDKPKKYADGGGLFLFIPVSGKKLWRMAYRYEKKAKLLTFGAYPHVSLRLARKQRDEAKVLLKSGIDPAVQKKTAQKKTVQQMAAQQATSVQVENASTFREVALEWHEHHTLHCEKNHRTFLLNRINQYFFPIFGDKAMHDISAADVMTAVETLQQAGATQGGRRLAEIYGQIYRYAVTTGKVQPTGDYLPLALSPKQTAHRAAMLDSSKLGQILCNLEQHNGYVPVSCALRLIPLFFVHSGILRCAKWEEFDFSRKLWTIPSERMTTRHEHIVPLARQSFKILKELHTYSRRGELLFPSVRCPETPVDKSTILAALRKRGYDGVKLTFAGIRSLAARLLAELGFEREVISLQLAHQGKSEFRARFDQRRCLTERAVMMQEWADYLTRLRQNTSQKPL